jgi:signal transduction histidine kinase
VSDEIPAQTTEKTRQALPPDLLHELRTPLGHILGYAELLQEQAEDAGNVELLPYIEKIHRAGEQLLELMDKNFTASPKSKG